MRANVLHATAAFQCLVYIRVMMRVKANEDEEVLLPILYCNHVRI